MRFGYILIVQAILTTLMTSSYSAPSSAAKKPRAAASSAARATGPRPVASRYDLMFGVYGNVDVVAPTSAPMLATVALIESSQQVGRPDPLKERTSQYMTG
jgi:hypothetical protein